MDPSKTKHLPQNPKALEFTEIERQVMDLLCREWSHKEIAQHLRMSVSAVKRHKKELCRKTGSRNYVGVVLFAFQSGLVRLDSIQLRGLNK